MSITVSDLSINMVSLPEMWVILLDGKFFAPQTSKHFAWTSEKKAIKAIEEHLFVNFCQGHYWHKNSGNTFEELGRWDSERLKQGLSSNRIRDDKQLKQQSKELAAKLLNDKIFRIQKISPI